jgi:hypothetical protein
MSAALTVCVTPEMVISASPSTIRTNIKGRCMLAQSLAGIKGERRHCPGRFFDQGAAHHSARLILHKIGLRDSARPLIPVLVSEDISLLSFTGLIFLPSHLDPGGLC